MRWISPAIAACVLAAGAGTALGGPTPPGPMLGVPEFMPGPIGLLTFAPSTPQGTSTDPPGVIENYGFYYRDATTGFESLGAIVNSSPQAPAPPLITFNAPDGHELYIRVEAYERVKPGVLTGSDTTNAQVRFRIDSTEPVGTVVIDGGRYSATRTLGLTLSADDPAPGPGLPASGVGTFQATESDFTCEPLSVAVNRPEPRRDGCPRPFTTTASFTLAPGLDGKRTIQVRFRDRSDVQRPAVSPLQRSGLVIGNGSAVVSREVFLDRLAPSPTVSFSATSAAVGSPITFSGNDSADGADNPARDSGLDPSGFVWDFGDGQTARGRRVTHAFAKAGTYRGRLTARDLAGNTAATPMQIEVLPAGAVASLTPAAGPLRLSRPRISGTRRARGRAIVRVDVSGAATLRGRILRFAADGRSTVVGRFRGRTLRPGTARMRVRWPAAGRYSVRVFAGSVATRTRVRILPRRPTTARPPGTPRGSIRRG